MTTYYARVDYSYSGDSKFTIPFSYIKKEHIVVLVNDVKTTNYTYITSSQIEVKDALQAEDVVSIRRTTPIKDKLVSFTDLNILNGETQNLAQEQVFNAVQEMYDDNTKFKIDTENNILQNRTEIDAQIEANNQELLNIQSSFESEVNTTIETVKEAAEKINNLKQAVTTATSAATTATNAANTASAAAESATSAAATATAKAEEVSQALATKEDKANKGVANGYAGLDANGKVPVAHIPNTSIELCDIGMALYVDETKGLRRYLNGQIVDINTNTQAFLNRLQQITTLHPSLLCTEEEWQTAKTMSAFGQVGKFVFNYSGSEIVSVRLPRVVNVQGLFDLQNLGMTVTESLPNITGSFDINTSFNPSGNGALYSKSRTESNNATSQGYNTKKQLGFDASLSSSTYKDNAHVQQEAIQYPYFIQIATGSETENNIINEIELNNPYSLFDSKYSDHELNNLSWLKSSGQWNAKAVYTDAYNKLLKVYNGTETVVGLSVKLSTETYTDYDFVLNTSDETFRLPLKTKLASGKAVVGNSMTLGLTDGTLNFGMIGNDSGTYLQYSTENYNTNVGSNILTSLSFSNKTLGITTDPTKSGIELSDSGLYLYFYVGETVQNANLIDAGRIGGQLANKQDKLIRYPIAVSNKSLMPSWYVVYNDGWCEQGGRYTINTNGSGTITFLKEFVDTSYTIFNSKESTDSSTWTVMFDAFETRTTSQIGIKANLTGYTIGGSWEAKGYIS